MSGQPLQNPLDASKFRREYLNQLALRAELDDKNLQANKVFKRTGQKSELQDYRTPSEKLRDIEGLKRSIRAELQKITSSQIATEIIESIDEGDIVFLAQNIENMIPTLKKAYAVGLTTADQFLSFYERYMRKWMATGGVELGLQQSTGNNILLSLETIKDNAIDKEQLSKIAGIILDTNYLTRRQQDQVKEQLDSLEEGIDILMSGVEVVMRNSAKYDPNVIADIQELVSNLSQNLPSKDQIDEIMNRIVLLERTGDTQAVREKIDELLGLVSQNSSFSLELDQLKRMLKSISERIGAKVGGGAVYKPIAEVERLDLSELKTYIKDIHTALQSGEFTRVFREDYGRVRQLKKERLVALLREVDDDLRLSLELALFEEGGGRKIGGKGLSKECCKNCSCEMRGGGLVRAYTPRVDDIDTETGIVATPKYSQFGRYLIHKNKLADDIISIRRPSGTFVGDFPSQRVSKNLGKVFRSIIGGGTPAFEDLNSLNEEERGYLHKLAKSARIQDRLNIPAPKKDEDEKDIHRFELLKGQIMSGQDNREMIKEFKILILKLSKRGLVPKGQVKDLLIDLATMGY